jgi:CheY-like chemotaxis protein
VEVVENGRVALERIFGPDAAPPPDVIVMDMHMPVLDGYEATQILRNRGYGGPILALTAWAQPEDREACLTAGCNEVVIKPVDRRTLVTLVAGHLNRRAAHG